MVSVGMRGNKCACGGVGVGRGTFSRRLSFTSFDSPHIQAREKTPALLGGQKKGGDLFAN